MTAAPHRVRCVCVIAALAGSAAAHAQAPVHGNPQAPSLIDRAVGDLDPLATSLRRVDPAYGNDLNRDQLRLLNPANPTTGAAGQFLLTAPEFRATFSQPDYIVFDPSTEDADLNSSPHRDGAFIELIPPGTVFHLGEAPNPNAQRGPTGPDNRLFRGGPIDPRVGGFSPAEPMDPRRTFNGPIVLPPVSPSANTLPAADTPQLQLQPWVTAEDLREAERLEVPIPEHVVMQDNATPLPPISEQGDETESP